MNGPLVNAPPGYIWSWRGHGKAHLLSRLSPYFGLLTTRCGKRVRGAGRVISTQVGGYGAAPCEECSGLLRRQATQSSLSPIGGALWT